LLTAFICWFIWITLKIIIFEKDVLKSNVVVIFTMCSFVYYWAGPYEEEAVTKLRIGARRLAEKSFELTWATQHVRTTHATMLMIEGPQEMAIL
jgi:hypothetical protein